MEKTRQKLWQLYIIIVVFQGRNAISKPFIITDAVFDSAFMIKYNFMGMSIFEF